MLLENSMGLKQRQHQLVDNRHVYECLDVGLVRVSPYILLASSELHSKISAAPITSPLLSDKGFPTSSVNHLARISFFFLISSEIFLIILDLSHGVVFFQISKPFFADSNARSISFLFAFDALPITLRLLD